MYELNIAAHQYEIENAYTKPLIKKAVEAIKPGETERIWGAKTFLKN